MPKIPSLVEMLEAGVHFGHQPSKWHPKMKPYIFGVRNNVHIIDVEKTAEKLKEVSVFINDAISKGKVILFLGTKKQIQDKIKKEAERCGCPYINQRWLGGFLTNFSVIFRMIRKYKDLVRKRETGELAKYTKKEQIGFEKEIKKLEEFIGGVLGLEKMPDILFVWDIKKEATAIREASKMKVPIIGICDTNTNPSVIDVVIPANDDATKTIDLILPYIADCVIEAKKASELKREAVKK